MKSYIIKYSGAIPFLFWFFINDSKTKKVECDMKSTSSKYFDFKSDVYEGAGYKVKGVLMYLVRYFFPAIVLIATFPEFTDRLDYYILALLFGGFISFAVLFRNTQVKLISSFAAVAILVLSFFYFNSLLSMNILLLLMPKYFLFFFVALRIYYDTKDNAGKSLYYLPTPRIFFYA